MTARHTALCPSCMTACEDGERCPRCGGSLHRENPSFLLPVGAVLRRPGLPPCHGYEIGAALGQGGFGVTYAGRDEAEGRRVAVKEYFPARCAKRGEDGITVVPLPGMEETYEGGRYSFVKEARVLSGLEGMPSVVQALAYLETNNTAYLVMEYLDGTPLHRLVDPKAGKRISPETLLPPLKNLLYDIGRLHEKKVIHRDIAPDNIMWMPDGSLKLLDFGSARSMEDGKSMTVMLKHGFAPVEQYQSHGQGTYTDVSAMAATIYYCLTAVAPAQSTERLLGDARLKRPRELGVALTPEEEDALMAMIDAMNASEEDKASGKTEQTLTESLTNAGKAIAEQAEEIMEDGTKRVGWVDPTQTLTVQALLSCLGDRFNFEQVDQVEENNREALKEQEDNEKRLEVTEAQNPSETSDPTQIGKEV